LTQIRTRRLVLRQWQDEDLEPFAELNADPEVMRHFPGMLTREQSDAFVELQRNLLAERGWGLWAVEADSGVGFIGFVGLAVPRFEAHFMPAVEIGWRLRRGAWGHGYATEAAGGAADYAFDEIGLDEIVSFTTTANERSRRVMQRIGMSWDPTEDFDHPLLPPGHPLRRHVLYRLRSPS